ncbi:MAG: HdeA/HdeB family chaperone [Vulcanimicrobiaceae bacterium]
MARLVLFAAALFSVSGAFAIPQSTSQMLSTPPQFDLRTLKCHDLLDASLTNRGYAMMLFWGFEAGKAGETKFVTSQIRAKSRKLVDFCANNPQTLVFDAIKRIGA